MATALDELETFAAPFQGEAETTQPASPASPDPNATPAPPNPEDDFWNAPVDDPDLPPHLRGQSRKKVWDENKRAIQRAHQAGEQKNEALRQAEAYRIANERLVEQVLNANRQPPAPPRTAAQRFGIKDDLDAYNVPQIVDRIPQVVNEQIDEANAPLQQRVNAAEGRLLFMESENARAQARAGLGVDADAWESIKSPLAAMIISAGWDTRDPRSWTAAAQNFIQTAPRFVPQVIETQPGAPRAGNGRPSPAAAPAARKRSTTGDPKLDEAARELIASYNLRLPKERHVAFDKVAESIQSDRSIYGGPEGS